MHCTENVLCRNSEKNADRGSNAEAVRFFLKNFHKPLDKSEFMMYNVKVLD